MEIVRIVEKTYDPLTVNAALNTESLDSVQADTITYQVVASAASAPTGTAIQIQGSLNSVDWLNLGTSTSVTGNGVFFSSISGLAFRYYRLSYTRSSGSYVATTSVLLKGRAF